MAHTCHAIACNIVTKPEMFMCKKHWYKVPKYLRDLIWAYYRPGQCDDYRISKEYSETAQEAIRLVAEKEGIAVSGGEPELMLYKVLAQDN